MLTELVEFGCKIDEKMKAMLSEIKENVQEGDVHLCASVHTNDVKETGTQISGLEEKEEINIQ